MSPALRLPAAYAGGLLAAILMCLTLTVVEYKALTPERLQAVVVNGIKAYQFQDESPTLQRDFFGQCAMFVMETVRPDSVVRNAVDTFFWHDFRYHPCDVLRFHYAGVAGKPVENLTFGKPPPWSYPNYPFGSRHLLGALTSFLEVIELRILYLMLSTASVLLILAGGMRSDPRQATLLIPIVFYLLFGFSLHAHGDNFNLAPGYFAGFFMLAIFLFFRNTLQPWLNRIFFFAATGALVTFFDELIGALPVILGLTIVLNHFFFIDREQPPRSYLRQAIVQGVSIFACFALAYAFSTAGRLSILKFAYGVNVSSVWSSFFGHLQYQAVGRTFGLADVLMLLWDRGRDNLTLGGVIPGTVLLVAAAVAWSLTLLAAGRALLRKRSSEAAYLATDVFVLAVAACGVMMWLILLPNFVYIHWYFINRLVALPCAFGFVGLILVARQLTAQRNHTTRIASERA